MGGCEEESKEMVREESMKDTEDKFPEPVAEFS